MVKKRSILLPSNFVDIIDHLDDQVSISQIEEKIIEHALEFTGAKWGSIRYYYGSQFVAGFSNVPLKYRLQPRKNGFMYRTIARNKLHLMTEKVLREAHPESHPKLKSILLVPLRMDNTTLAIISLLDTKDKNLHDHDTLFLNDFGTVYGRVLNMAHKFAAEKKAGLNRDSFMSFAAHEIKNPLMALSSYIQLIQKSLEKKKVINNDWLEKMGAEVVRMRLLIDELLQVRKSHDGELIYSTEVISVKTLFSQVIDNFKVRNPHRKLNIIYKNDVTGVTLMGDEIKLTQVFINLLNNAHKFSDENLEILVSLSTQNNVFKVAIKDQGIGIAADEVPYIFNEFYRGSNSDQKKGIGVGLYLVKSIIANHKGTISVRSRLGKGTTFTVSLPHSLKD